MTDQRGWIFAEDAYAQGKMLDHTGWRSLLPRRITPSDIDVAFDNNAQVIFTELSRFHSDWRALKPGQRMLYENVIKGGAHCACLVKHSVPDAVQINTRSDVETFHVMIWDYGLVYSSIFPGKHWAKFVLDWFTGENGALFVRRKILGRSAANGSDEGHTA